MAANIGKTVRDWIAPLAIVLGMVWGGGRLAQRIEGVEHTMREGFTAVNARLSTLDNRLWELRGQPGRNASFIPAGPTCPTDATQVYLTPLTTE